MKVWIFKKNIKWKLRRYDKFIQVKYVLDILI